VSKKNWNRKKEELAREKARYELRQELMQKYYFDVPQSMVALKLNRECSL